MKVIVEPRRGGKTTALIKLADNNNGYIVCESVAESHRIMDTAVYMGCNINLPISYHEFMHSAYYAGGVEKFFIDNVDRFLQSLTCVPIMAVTITDEGEHEGPTDEQMEAWKRMDSKVWTNGYINMNMSNDPANKERLEC